MIHQNVDSLTSANLRIVPQPLSGYYLHAKGGAAQKVMYTLLAIALFILGMAVINFINLSVSRSSLPMLAAVYQSEFRLRKAASGRLF